MDSLSVLHDSRPPSVPFPTTTTTHAAAISPPVRISTTFPHFGRPNCRVWALKAPRGFGSAPIKRKAEKKQRKKRTGGDGGDDDGEEEEDAEEDGYEYEGTIPEVVTERMMRRMGVSVGAPLGVGLLLFPFFYYLKVVTKVDVPTWVPVLVSFFFFGTALLGVSYGIVSSSWDPLREGSLLGWNEARRNWPVFWQSLWGRSGDDRSGRGRASSRKM